jgi:hypothetical protein
MNAAERHPSEREPGSGGLTFPIKLRCTSVTDLLSEPGLEAGFARALGRAFARAGYTLPAPLAVGGGVALQPPYLAGGALGEAQASTLLIRVQRALESAARAQSLPIAATSTTRLQEQERQPNQTNPEIHQPAELAERFDPARYDAASETYLIPSYNPPPAQRGRRTKVRPSGEIKPRNIAGAQCSAVRILLPNIIVFEGNLGPLGADLDTVLDQSETPRFISYDAGEDMFVVTPGETVILLKVTLSNRTQHDLNVSIAAPPNGKAEVLGLEVLEHAR